MVRIIAFCFVVVLESCTHKSFSAAPVPSAGANDCPSALPTFNTGIQQIFSASCAKTGCHDGNNMPLNFSVYQQVKPLLNDSAIYYAVVIDRSMPQDTPLSEAQIRAIRCWYLSGYPED